MADGHERFYSRSAVFILQQKPLIHHSDHICQQARHLRAVHGKRPIILFCFQHVRVF